MVEEYGRGVKSYRYPEDEGEDSGRNWAPQGPFFFFVFVIQSQLSEAPGRASRSFFVAYDADFTLVFDTFFRK